MQCRLCHLLNCINVGKLQRVLGGREHVGGDSFRSQVIKTCPVHLETRLKMNQNAMINQHMRERCGQGRYWLHCE